MFLKKVSVIILLVVLSALSVYAESTREKIYTDPTTEMKFAFINGGSFTMGDTYGSDIYAKPPRKVTLKSFYIGVTEVTFNQYDLFCTEIKRDKPSDNGNGRNNRPVINVSYHDAIAFTKWLSEKSGQTYRLPSEAEWEYAARGGKNTPFWWGSKLGKGNANCRDCGSQWDGTSTASVGSFGANNYGIYDTVGNVYEWVLDSWYPDYKNAPKNGSARLDPNASEYVSRGGSYLEVASSMPASARNWGPPTPHIDIGFRVLLEIN